MQPFSNKVVGYTDRIAISACLMGVALCWIVVKLAEGDLSVLSLVILVALLLTGMLLSRRNLRRLVE